MIPVQLKIKGLNSFVEEQIIDFKSLTEVGLFGIFGQTGSGKSTIIDAMTLALFAEMSRYDKKNISKQFINANCNESTVSFRFKLNEKLYEITRSFRNKLKTVEQYVHKLILIEDENITVLEDTVTALNKAVVEMLGLSYDDFVRSVVLPQGRFSEVLLLENRERRDMLQRIFRLDEYGEVLHKRILEETRKYKNEVDLIENSLSHYENISEEYVEESKNRYFNENDTLIKLKEQLEISSSSLLKNKELLNLANEKNELTKRLNNHELSKKEINNKIELLEKSKKADVIKPKLDLIEKITKDIESCHIQLQESKKLLSDYSIKERSSLSEYELLLKEKSEKIPVLIEKETNLKQAIKMTEEYEEVNKAIKSLIEEHSKRKKSIDLLHEKKEMILNNKKIEEELQEKILKRKSEVSIEPEERESIGEKFYFLKGIEEKKIKINTLLNKLKEEKEQYKETILKHDKIKKLYEEERANLQKINEENTIVFAVSMLKKNEPCPVCGSLNHPSIATIQNKEKSYNNIDEILEHKEILEKQLNEIALKMAVEKERVNNIQLEFNKIKEEIEEHGEIKLSFTKVTEKFEQLKRFDLEKSKLEITEKEKSIKILELQKNLDKLENELLTLQKEVEGISVLGKEKREMSNNLKEKLQNVLEDKEVNSYLQEVRDEIESINKNEIKLKSILEDIIKHKNEINEITSRLETKLEILKSDEQNKNDELRQELLQLNFNKDEIKTYYLSKLQQEEIEKEIIDYNEQKNYIFVSLENVNKKLKDENVEDILGKVKLETEENKRLSEETEEKSKELAVLKESINKMEKDLVKVIELRANLKKSSYKLSLLTELSSLFSANNFIEFISRQQLKYVAHEASVKLKEMTRGRYALELDGTAFVIRDDHNGGMRRVPKTLSGGETFMVSLCLALALSSKIQLKNNAPLEFFFLDEGFGSLDSTLLDTVMNALEQFRSNKMTIGIISHVEEIRNRLPIKLIVKPPLEGVRGTKVSIE